MPVFEVEANGKQFEIEAPNLAAATAALDKFTGSKKADANTAGDLAASAGIGLVKGGLGIFGLPADLANLAARGVDYVAGTNMGAATQPLADVAGSGALRGYLERVTGPLYEPKTTAGQYMQTVAEFAPAIIGGPGFIGTRALTRAVAPGLASEAAGQVTQGSTFEPVARVAGALLGAAAPAGLARAITPNPMTGERLAALNTLRAEGVHPPASLSTGSKVLKAAESDMGGGRYEEAITRMNEQFTGAALRRAGIQGEARATPDVINAAEDRIGQVFDAVAARNGSIPLDRRFINEAQQVATDFRNLTGADSPLIAEFIRRIGNTGQRPNISGEAYQSLQSDIARYARNAVQPELRMALQDLRGALDAGVERGLRNPRDLAEWRQARRQWANMIVINRAVSGSTEAVANGFITPAKLTQAIESMRRGTYSRGRGDFAQLARAGNQIMKGYQDSGTPTRARAMAMPAAIGAVLGSGFGALPGAVMGAAAPFVAGRALMSRPVQSYLQNQRLTNLLGTIGPRRNVAAPALAQGF